MSRSLSSCQVSAPASGQVAVLLPLRFWPQQNRMFNRASRLRLIQGNNIIMLFMSGVGGTRLSNYANVRDVLRPFKRSSWIGVHCVLFMSAETRARSRTPPPAPTVTLGGATERANSLNFKLYFQGDGGLGRTPAPSAPQRHSPGGKSFYQRSPLSGIVRWVQTRSPIAGCLGFKPADSENSETDRFGGARPSR